MDNELVLRNQEVRLTPAEVVENSTTQAKLLMDIVERTKCYQNISGKKYLQVEAWETIGAFNRTHAETESITPIRGVDNNVDPTEIVGYQAHVQLWKDGVVVGGAVMPCYFTENCCKGKEGDAKHKACMSAAQTFATSKAYRMNFSYIAILAGYQPLPAEEVTDDMKPEPDKTQHWCKEHDTAFFMRGKMKAYAHPIGDTGEWCHEHRDSKPANKPQTPQGAVTTATDSDTSLVDELPPPAEKKAPVKASKEVQPEEGEDRTVTAGELSDLKAKLGELGKTMTWLGSFCNQTNKWKIHDMKELTIFQLRKIYEELGK